jgi:hypothetical protein
MFDNTASTSKKKIAAMVAIANTVSVAIPVSRLEDQEILDISCLTWRTNCAGEVFAILLKPIINLATTFNALKKHLSHVQTPDRRIYPVKKILNEMPNTIYPHKMQD